MATLVRRARTAALIPLLAPLLLLLALLAPAPAQAATWPVVRSGDSGVVVRAVQHLLTHHGIATTVDGDFGPATERGVTSFQSGHGLTADGVVGERTWTALTPTLREGSNSTAVKALQELLNAGGARLTVDGAFGPATREAVRSFQSSASLTVDGVVGPQTWLGLAAGSGDVEPEPDPEPQPDPDPDPSTLTYDDLVAMFGARVGDRTTVEEGLPSLTAEMAAREITTPERQAAFLATLVNESRVLYNADQGTGETYTGRGFIQLTGSFNYGPAGDYLGVDLLNQPELARSLDWSAKIAGWYWTVARPINPMADALDMGRVNAAIGYAHDPDEDVERCDDFKAALDYLNGDAGLPSGINCVRPETWTRAAAMERPTRQLGPDEAAPLMRTLLRGLR